MAADEEVEQNNEAANTTKEGAEQAKALDKLTDVVEEKQLDENKVKQAMSALASAQKAEKEAKMKRDRELAAVKINKEDIDVVAAEFEIDRKAAELQLRQNAGDLEATLNAYL